MQTPLPAPAWRTARTAVVLGGGAAGCLAAGWLSATRSPFLAGGAVGGAVFLALALRRPAVAMVGLLAVIALLPFGVVPLRLGVAPTFLDVAVAVVFFLWLALAASGRVGTRLSGPGAAVLACVVVLGAAYLLSEDVVALDENGRAFAKLLLAQLLFLPVLNLAARPAEVRRLVGWLLVLSGVEALLGLALYAAPRTLAYRALASLGPLGYPTDDTVLRYRPDTDILRATGTAVDPNMLGALLMVAAAIAVPLLLAPRPALPRRLTGAVLVLVVPCLLLTESRGSWLGLVGAVVLAGALRHRRVLLALLVATPLALATPAAGRFTEHLLSGLRAEDRASAMRLGELVNAARVIALHPWFGAGWGDGARSIELTFTLGVSNIYLTLAERAGLPALAVFLAALGVLAATLWPALRRRLRDPGDDGLLLGLAGGLVATQIAGLLDHHFVRFPHLVALLWVVAALAVALALAPPEPRPRGPRPGRASVGPPPARDEPEGVQLASDPGRGGKRAGRGEEGGSPAPRLRAGRRASGAVPGR